MKRHEEDLTVVFEDIDFIKSSMEVMKSKTTTVKVPNEFGTTEAIESFPMAERRSRMLPELKLMTIPSDSSLGTS